MAEPNNYMMSNSNNEEQAQNMDPRSAGMRSSNSRPGSGQHYGNMNNSGDYNQQ